jgi:transcriptional regulator with XRE-family HTH domain
MPAHPESSYIRLPYLQAWRESRVLTQQELAGRAHLARESISRAERGQRVTAVTIGRLARAFKVDRSALLYPPSNPIESNEV